MKILLVGGNGTIGKTVATALKEKHDVIIGGRSAGDVLVDIADSDSIAGMYESVGPLDAIVCIAGEAKWSPFADLSEEDYYIGIRSKLMGQVNLVRLGVEALNPGGSITLTTGILADSPVVMTASASMVNGAIHSFVQAAALEMPPGIRLNVVSAGLVELSKEKYKDYFPGYDAIPMERVINGYLRSIHGRRNGEIIRVY